MLKFKNLKINESIYSAVSWIKTVFFTVKLITMHAEM